MTEKQTADEGAVHAPLYADGQWTTTPDEFAAQDIDDYFEALSAAGFSPHLWTRVGSREHVAPLNLEVYLRWHWDDRPPRFLVDVCGSGGRSQRIYVKDVPDLMDLMSQWLPTVQSGVVTDALCQLLEPKTEYGHPTAMVEILERLLKDAKNTSAPSVDFPPA